VGLDTVEMIMDIEDEFCIAIADEDASRLVTVGQLYDHVLLLLKRNPARRTMPCASAHCFYELRREMLADRAVPRVRIRPDSQIDAIVPPGSRREVLTRLTRKLNFPSPPFRYVARTGIREPQPGLRVRDLVASYVQQAPFRFIRGGRLDETAVWNALCEIILKYAPGDPGRIKRDTHIVNDLFLD
jgi:hypothetical protein